MAIAMNKRKVLTIEEKVCDAVNREWNKENWNVWEFGLINSWIQMTCKNRAKIIGVFEQKRSSIKQFRNPEWSDIVDVLHK